MMAYPMRNDAVCMRLHRFVLAMTSLRLGTSTESIPGYRITKIFLVPTFLPLFYLVTNTFPVIREVPLSRATMQAPRATCNAEKGSTAWPAFIERTIDVRSAIRLPFSEYTLHDAFSGCVRKKVTPVLLHTIPRGANVDWNRRLCGSGRKRFSRLVGEYSHCAIVSVAGSCLCTRR